MKLITIALILAAFEALLFWGKTIANRDTMRREGENYKLPLLSSGPWWVRWFHKLWFAFHFPAILVFLPITILYAALGRNGQLTISTQYIHYLNFIIFIGAFAWFAAQPLA